MDFCAESGIVRLAWGLINMTKAEIEDRRVIARRVYEELCARFPDRYIAMVLPRGDAEPAPDISASKLAPT
jgi:hypothetical protein